MAVAVLIGLELLHVHNPLSCGSHGEPVPMVSLHLQAQVQVDHGYSHLQHHPPGRYANRDTSGGNAVQCSNGMGENLVAAEAVLYLDAAVGGASDRTARWAVDGAAAQALDGSAEKTPDGAWAARNGVDGLAGLEVAQHGLFPVIQLDQHGWYLV